MTSVGALAPSLATASMEAVKHPPRGKDDGLKGSDGRGRKSADFLMPKPPPQDKLNLLPDGIVDLASSLL